MPPENPLNTEHRAAYRRGGDAIIRCGGNNGDEVCLVICGSHKEGTPLQSARADLIASAPDLRRTLVRFRAMHSTRCTCVACKEADTALLYSGHSS